MYVCLYVYVCVCVCVCVCVYGACTGGGPVESLTWCANHLNSRGLSLQRGHLVITGATCKCSSSAFKVGDAVSANVGELGSVDSTISP